jgi:site-specific recombinase XerD
MDRFVQRMRDEHRVRPGTLDAYSGDIAMLSRWAAQEQRSLLGLAGADLARYLRERFEQGTRASTLERQLSGWRRFYAFLVKQGALAANPAAAVRGLRVARHEPRQVPDDVLRRLLRPEFGRDAFSMAAYRARRNHAIVWILYATGLNVSDVRLLRWSQIDEKLRVINVPVRNNPARSVPLDANSLAVFKALRHCAGTAAPDQAGSVWCFPTASGLPMSRQALCHAVRKWVRDCGSAEVVTPSMLRQSGRVQQTRRHQR